MIVELTGIFEQWVFAMRVTLDGSKWVISQAVTAN